MELHLVHRLLPGHVISNNKFWHLGTYDVTSTIPNWGGGVHCTTANMQPLQTTA